MNNNYGSLTEDIQNRINPDHLRLEKSFENEIMTLSYSDVLRYVRFAMRGVDPEYTSKSKLAGERVKTHLSSTMTGVTFRYQGSVMTNTHIRSFSDVDLLTISNDFYTYDSNQMKSILENQQISARYTYSQLEKIRNEIGKSSYQYDSLAELRRIRIDAENKLSSVYSICDKTKPKSIRITNTDLKRDVDIVVANWYDDVLSVINDKGEYRGIQVYNKDSNSKGDADYPFLSIDRINDRGSLTVGRVKKMIRFLKNLKAKSKHDIKLSSFDFNAICYDISVSVYQNSTFYQLVPVLYNQISSLVNDSNHSDRLTSVDGREYILKYNYEKTSSLRLILAELEGVYNDLKKDVSF